MKKLTLILLLNTSLFSALFSQTPAYKEVRQITMKDGLPSTNIECIFKDSKGFLWIGTWGCAYRYDGYTFYEYRYHFQPQSTDSTSHCEVVAIYCISEDKDGILWMGSNNGLLRCNPAISNSIPELIQFYGEDWRKNEIYSIYDDKQGNLWLGLRTGGEVVKFNKKTREFLPIKLIPHKSDNSKSEDIITRSIEQDKDNNFWFASSVGLYKYNPVKKKIILYLPSPENIRDPANSIMSVLADENPDVIWVCTLGGLYTFSIEKESFNLLYPGNQEVEDKRNNATAGLKKDREGNIWFRTPDRIYNFKPGEEPISLKKIYSYPSRDSYTISYDFDESGNIWLIRANKGLTIISPESNKFRAIPSYSNYLKSGPSSACADREGNIWIGTWGTGVTKYNKKNNEFTDYMHDPEDSTSLSGNAVSYIYQDKSGTLWIGTDGSGLNKMNLTDDGLVQFKRYLYDPENPGSINSNKIFRIIEDAENNVWFFVYNYIDKYDRERDVFLHLNLEPDCINFGTCEQEETQNEIWFPRWNQINRIIPPFIEISEDTLKAAKIIEYNYFPDNPSSKSNMVLSNTFCISRIYKPGTLWFGSHWGLGKMIKNSNKKKPNRSSVQFKIYSKEDGFDANGASGILEDKRGNLWISTDKGLFRLDPHTELFTNYPMSDVFPSNSFSGWQACIDADGFMYFPHLNGLLIFHPDSIQDVTSTSPIYITDLNVNTQNMVSGKNASLELMFPYTNEVRLSHNQNYLTIEFSVLDFADPQRNQYLYKMEGLDEEWINAGTRHYASYSNLRHGNYIFRVQGAGSNGVWNTEGTSIKIIIKPPWWKTKVAYISYFLILFLLLGGYIRWRTWMLIKEKNKLEKQVRDRTHEIREANEELLQQKEELQTTLENLQKTQEQLIESEKMAALGGLVAGVAHEINTPVGITITAASGLLEETVRMADLFKENKISRAEFKEYLNSSNHAVRLIMSNMERTAAMVQSFKQISVDQASEIRRVFNLKDYTQDIVRSLYPKFKNRKITFEMDIDSRLEINNYPGAYSQIVTNLIINSLAHGFEEEQEGKIELTAVNKDGNLIIEYKDNGKGIAKENLKKIFDPFFTTNRKSGTGLGLHIVYNLVTQKLMGKIEVQSTLGRGAEFTISIPDIQYNKS